MIKNYGIFNYHELNNELVILFDEGRNFKEQVNEEVSLLKRDNQVVGYAINNFIKYAKIKYSGIIFLPSNILIDVINSVIKNASLETLEYKQYSGYVIKNINNQNVVYANEGTFLKDESISKGHICTYDDLYIKNENPNNVVIIDDELSVGKDFFLTEAK